MVYLPAHGSVLHACVSLLGPEHCAPPLDGGGLVQVRERSCCPPPQAALHCPQFPKPVQPPLTTEFTAKKVSFLILICQSNSFKDLFVSSFRNVRGLIIQVSFAG